MQELLRSDVAGRPGLPTATVTRVLRIENTVAWSNYQHKKATMLQLSRGARPDAERAPPHRVLCAEANELYLFHGTSPEVASLVARHGFDERVSNLHGLYGGGCYFAENAAKSHHYNGSLTGRGERVVLYCRVLLGDAFHTAQRLGGQKQMRRAPDKPGSGGAAHDSVIAARGATNHREFIVYDRTQVYPEFMVFYT